MNPTAPARDGEPEEWEVIYDKFHDQSKLDAAPGYYFHAGLQNIKIGPTPDFRSDVVRIGESL